MVGRGRPLQRPPHRRSRARPPSHDRPGQRRVRVSAEHPTHLRSGGGQHPQPRLRHRDHHHRQPVRHHRGCHLRPRQPLRRLHPLRQRRRDLFRLQPLRDQGIPGHRSPTYRRRTDEDLRPLQERSGPHRNGSPDSRKRRTSERPHRHDHPLGFARPSAASTAASTAACQYAPTTNPPSPSPARSTACRSPSENREP